MYNLGRMYLHGKGVEKDFVQALHLFKVAYQHPQACFYAGHMHSNGIGINTNDTIALEFFEKALEIDPVNVNALYATAFVYEKDGKYNKSIEYLEKIIEIEPFSSIALYNLACHYFKGFGVSKDIVMAAILLRKTRRITANTYPELSLVLMLSSNIFVQYHHYMGLNLQFEVFRLLEKNPEIIGQTIIDDTMLLLQHKYNLFNGKPFSPSLNIKTVLIEGGQYNIVAKFYLYFAKSYPEKAEKYCAKFYQNLSFADKPDRNIANDLFYFRAIDSQRNGDVIDALGYCLKTCDHTLANYLLANLLYTLFDFSQHKALPFVCLYLLKIKSREPSPFSDRDILVANLINEIHGNKGIKHDVFEEDEIARHLAGKELSVKNTLFQLALDFFLAIEDFSAEIAENKLHYFFMEQNMPNAMLSFWKQQLKRFSQEDTYTNFFGEESLLNVHQRRACSRICANLEKKETITKWMFFSSFQKTTDIPDHLSKKIFKHYIAV